MRRIVAAVFHVAIVLLSACRGAGPPESQGPDPRACGALAACSIPHDGLMTGWIEAEWVHVSAPATGRLAEVAVHRGQRVVAGAPLFQLGEGKSRPERLERAARLAEVEAKLRNLRSGRRAQELAVLEGQKQQAVVGMQASAAALQRLQALADRGFVSNDALTRVRADAEQAQARVAELEAALQAARLPARHDELAAAQAAVQATRAQLMQGDWDDNERSQRAPFDALVADVLFRAGERVPANASVVVLVPSEPTKGLKLRFYAPTSRLPRLSPGTQVQVRCEGCPADLRAKVSHVAAQAEFTPPMIYGEGTREKLVFMVEARFEDGPLGPLVAGMPASVLLPEPQGPR